MKTKTLIEAMRIIERDIESEDGIANSAIRQAADRLEAFEFERRTLQIKIEELLHITSDHLDS